MARSSSTPAFPWRLGKRSKRSRKASVTTRVMVSPVSWAIAAARRCASGSLIFSDLIKRRLSVNTLDFYHSTRLRWQVGWLLMPSSSDIYTKEEDFRDPIYVRFRTPSQDVRLTHCPQR